MRDSVVISLREVSRQKSTFLFFSELRNICSCSDLMRVLFKLMMGDSLYLVLRGVLTG